MTGATKQVRLTGITKQVRLTGVTNELESETRKMESLTLSRGQATLTRYRKRKAGKRLVLALLIAAAILVGIVSITLGPLKLSFAEVAEALLHRLFPGLFSTPGELAERTVWFIRLPRLVTGLAAGFNLGIAGAVMQPVLRNPMASPFTLGISSGAGFGAALAILFGKSLGGATFSATYFTVVSAFVFALLSALIILGLAGSKGASPQNMILTGIALSYLFSAGTTVMQYFAESWAVTEIVFWMVGTLAKSTWGSLKIIVAAAVVCAPYLLMKTRDLNVMTAGDDVAGSLGVRVTRTRVLLLTAASLLTATTICFTGTIGFIGLVAPHIARMILGGDNRFVVPASGITGGLLLSLADMVAVNLMPPVVIPIGVMTAFTGVPLFIYLIMKNRSEFWQ